MESKFDKNNSLIFQISVNSTNKYLNIIKLLKFYDPFSKLSEREMEVLSLWWKEYRELSSEKNRKYTYIFKDEEFKNDICRRLGIKYTNYNNIKKNLKKKGFIVNDSFPVSHEKFLDERMRDNIIFTFKIQE